MGFAAEIAAAHPRSRFPALAGLLRRQPRLVWLALVLLLVAAAVGAALVGMRPIEGPFRVLVGPPVPVELYGRWAADATGADRYLDLNSTALVHEADGRALDTLGSVVGFQPTGPGSVEGRVLIHSSLPCGDASYRLVVAEVPSSGPTAAPAPSPIESQQVRLSHATAIRFVDPADRCPARQSILQSGPWVPLMLTLQAGGTYGSLDFGEPFHLTLSPDAALGLFSAEVGTMYQLQPNQLRISHAWWGGAFIDDVPVNRVPCRPDLGTLPDIPTSVDDVGAWLSAPTTPGFNGPTEVIVDGRRALRWEISDACTAEIPAISELATGYEYYAIPTGDDVILFVVHADTLNESKVAERIVLAMHFD